MARARTFRFINNGKPVSRQIADYEARETITELEAKIEAMVVWLEANQPDVFKRGIWDAIGDTLKGSK